jgi:hypothetical protein
MFCLIFEEHLGCIDIRYFQGSLLLLLLLQEARMGAEDGQKKRGKRKGLGGLTPEKKKKLKVIIENFNLLMERMVKNRNISLTYLVIQFLFKLMVI